MLRKPCYALQLKNRLKSWFDTHRGFMHVLLVHDEIFRTVSCQPCGIVRGANVKKHYLFTLFLLFGWYSLYLNNNCIRVYANQTKLLYPDLWFYSNNV